MNDIEIYKAFQKSPLLFIESNFNLVPQEIRDEYKELVNQYVNTGLFNLIEAYHFKEFEKGKNIQLKFNYSPNVKAIKLVDLSKSGKKATAVFTFAHGDSTSREENVNVSSIIDQVYGLRNNIVQRTLAE